MAKKVFKEWKVKLGKSGITAEREEDGLLVICEANRNQYVQLDRAEARRLFQKLSGDYED